MTLIASKVVPCGGGRESCVQEQEGSVCVRGRVEIHEYVGAKGFRLSERK